MKQAASGVRRYGIAYTDGANIKRLSVGMAGSCESAVRSAVAGGRLRCAGEGGKRMARVAPTLARTRSAAPIREGYSVKHKRELRGEGDYCSPECVECEWARIAREGVEFEIEIAT